MRKLGATPLIGTLDPTEAESWLESTERIFDLMMCTPAERFDYAVFLLQGDAYSWWKTVPHSRDQPPVLTWEDFLREFQEKYAPTVYKREKRREFIELKQGSMSVAEYGLKFSQLSVYALNLITLEEEKCQKFEEGLHYDIRNRLTPYNLENYSRLMAAAIRAVRLAKERKAYFSNQKESSSRSGKRKDRTFSGSRDGSSSRYSGPKKGGAGSSSQSGQKSSTGQRPFCSFCNKHHSGEC